LLDVSRSQQDSSLALGKVHLAVGELLIEREEVDVEVDEEIPDVECPLVRLVAM
jgi:hypothetical protein